MILALVAVLFAIAYWFNRLPSTKKRSLLKATAFTLVVVLFAGLALTGRLHWIIAAIGSIAPLVPRIIGWLVRVLPSLQSLFRFVKSTKASSQFKNTNAHMETAFLKMFFDQLSGDLSGVVLKGEFRGQQLKDLALEQLLAFLNQCSSNDPESAAMLMAYLDRYFPSWRNHQQSSQQQQSWQDKGDMSVDEARKILGIDAKATEDDIIEAHKKLMQKFHPDRGGSDYLASKINRAKEKLLSEKK